jgi:multiple sugar transport system permease protein
MNVHPITKAVQIAPLALLLVAMTVFPTLFSYFLSVHEVRLASLRTARFVGLENFAAVLTDSSFYAALGFSLRFAVIATLVQVVLGLLIALWFNRKSLPGKGILLSLMIVPIMISPALLGIMFRLMLNEFVGPIAYYLQQIGLPGALLLTPQYIVTTLTVIDVAQWTPFTFLILYSALQTVPRDLYEAAAVDGASAVQKFIYITLPFLVPFLFITVFVRGIDSFRTFDMIHVLTGGGPGTLTTTISLYIHKLAFNAGQFGQAAAASTVLLVLLSIPLSLVIGRVLRQEGR